MCLSVSDYSILLTFRMSVISLSHFSILPEFNLILT